MWVMQKRHRMPFAPRQPRRTTKQRWVSMNRMDTTTGHDVVEGLRCNPRTMPMTAIRASVSHVAPRESINRAKALPLLLRYCMEIAASHSASSTTLSGKRNMSKGKLPMHTSATTDNTPTAPTAQALGRSDFMLVCDVAITSDKGSLISRYTGYITGKIWIKTTDCNLFRAIRRLYALRGTPFFGSAHCMPPAVLRRAGQG